MSGRRRTATGPAGRAEQPPGRRQLGSGERTVTPLYHQMYLVLRQRIRDRSYPADQPLPGEHQLAGQFGVSRVTVRRTLENLELDGLVVRRRGIGTFPVAQPVEHQDRYNIGGLVAAGRVPPGTATRNETLLAGPASPPATIARHFPDERRLYRIQRRRSFRDEPFAVLTAWTRLAHGPQLAELAEAHGGVPVALEYMQLPLSRAEQAITAQVADQQAAALLGVPVGAALLAMSTLISDRNDRCLVCMESLFRPDRYEYRSTMLRRPGARGERWQLLSS